MREAPTGIDDVDVLHLVRDQWAPEADAVEHLPVGFGAHHWAASRAGTRTHFTTLDALGTRHTAGSLEAAYGAAAALAQHVDFVLAPLPTRAGTYTAPIATSALSATRWVWGETPAVLDGPRTAGLLAQLHAATPPATTPTWEPLVSPSLADQLAGRCSTPWTSGPYGETVRLALREHLPAIARWTAGYHRLCAVARTRPWVVTHGEPHESNQLSEDGHLWLVDWESVKLAPAERDLRTLLEREHALPADPAMLELFDLEWRLDEISQYAAWFAAPHTGTASDDVAVEGLLHELIRPPLRTTGTAWAGSAL